MKNQKDRKKKKKQNVLESEIMSLMQKSMKTALDMVLDEIFKEWK